MDEFILLLKILVVVISLVSWLSFKSSKNQAEKEAKQVGMRDCARELTPEEEVAVLQLYGIQLATRNLVLVEGELSAQTLTSSQGGREDLYMLNGAKIQLKPKALAMVAEHNRAWCAYHNNQLYVVTFNNYSVVNHNEINQIDKDNTHRITEARPGKLITYELEVLSHRETVLAEEKMLLSQPGAWGYCCGLIVAAVITTLFFAWDEPLWGALAGVVPVMIIYRYLFKKLAFRAERLPVTRMRGKLDAIQDEERPDGLWSLCFFNQNVDDKLVFYVPQSVVQSLQSGESYEFEIYAKLSRIVWIRSIYSLEEVADTTPLIKRYHLGLMVGWLAVCGVLLINIPMPETFIAARIALAPKSVTLSGPKQLIAADVSPGSYLTLSGYRHCYMPTSIEKQHARWSSDDFCDRFIYADAAQTSMARPLESDLSEMADRYRQLHLLPELPPSVYLQLRLLASMQGESLVSRDNIVYYRQGDLIPVARFIDRYCDQLSDCEAARSGVINVWKSIMDKDCGDYCWDSVKRAPEQRSEQESTFLKRYEARQMLDEMFRIGRAINDRQVIELADALSQPSGSVKIRLVRGETPISDDLQHKLSGVESNTPLTSRQISGILAQIRQEQPFHDISGYVVQVTRDKGMVSLVLDQGLTPDMIHRDAIQLLILCLCFVIAVIHGGYWLQNRLSPKMISDVCAKHNHAMV